MTVEATRIAWTWRHAVCASDLPATTRHVLLTLSMFMNEMGEGCYPSIADLCRYSGLDKKTVLKHIAAARDAGWLASEQHGYRGQRWKRNEYTPRWPQRDLLAGEPDGEGGGTAPPPSDEAKVVEPVPKGGGTEGSKVVEHVHQDKTSPETNPITSPVEREARASADGQGEPDGEAKAASRDDDPRALERRVKRLAHRLNWPGWANSSTDWTLAQFAKLSPDERMRAEERAAAYLAHCGKKALSLGTYFLERKFDDLPAALIEAARAAEQRVEAPPFGKLWSAVRLARLLKPHAPLPAPTAFISTLMAQPDERGLRERLAHRARHGWPAVNAMHGWAERGQGQIVGADLVWLEPIATEFEKVRVGSDPWRAWQEEHERRGWPWLPDPGRQEWVYFPAGGPDGLAAFEAAIRGHEDDGGGREAAE